VISVVQELLVEFLPAHDLQPSFHRAVRLLAVFTTGNERGHQPTSQVAAART